MSDTVDFSSYMNKPLGEMKRTVLPEGHYFVRFKGNPEGKESSKGKPMLFTKFVIDSAAEDVDTASLPNEGRIEGKVISVNHMLAEDFGQEAIGDMIRAAIPNADPAQGFGVYINQLDGLPIKVYNKPRARDKDDPEAGLQEDFRKFFPAT